MWPLPVCHFQPHQVTLQTASIKTLRRTLANPKCDPRQCVTLPRHSCLPRHHVTCTWHVPEGHGKHYADPSLVRKLCCMLDAHHQKESTPCFPLYQGTPANPEGPPAHHNSSSTVKHPGRPETDDSQCTTLLHLKSSSLESMLHCIQLCKGTPANFRAACPPQQQHHWKGSPCIRLWDKGTPAKPRATWAPQMGQQQAPNGLLHLTVGQRHASQTKGHVGTTTAASTIRLLCLKHLIMANSQAHITSLRQIVNHKMRADCEPQNESRQGLVSDRGSTQATKSDYKLHICTIPTFQAPPHPTAGSGQPMPLCGPGKIDPRNPKRLG